MRHHWPSHFFNSLTSAYICATKKLIASLLHMKKIFIFILAGLLIPFLSIAQDTLPKITVTNLGRKALVSWTNNYPNVTNIVIQRSGDSLRNFSTIGSVINVQTQMNGFVDTKEFLPNNQFYRLFITFEGGSYLFTQSHRPGADTSQTLVDLPVYEAPVKTWFEPSRYVYTGKDHNVIISLPDVAQRNYSLKFYEEQGELLFEIKKINEKYLTLDKVNFMRSGLFSFELFDNRVLVERHKVYIPKDGKPIPALDRFGREIRQK